MTRLFKSGDWKVCGRGFDDVATFMDSLGLDKIRLTADERKELVAAAKTAQATVSNRAIADALGVSRQTINNDVGGNNLPPRPDNTNENNNAEHASGNNLPPHRTLGTGDNEWFTPDRAYRTGSAGVGSH